MIDNCDTNADYEVAETILGEEDGVQTLERIYTASDACGNTTVFNQLITVTLAFEGCTDMEATDAGQLRRRQLCVSRHVLRLERLVPQRCRWG